MNNNLAEKLMTLDNPGGVSDNEWEEIKYYAAKYRIPIDYEEDGQLDRDWLRGYRYGKLLVESQLAKKRGELQ